MSLPDYTSTSPLSDDSLRRIDAWWRAANYLSVGQIYLLTNPLLREPLERIRLYTSRSPRRRARKNMFTFNAVALRL
jgi:phosphoketolase